MFEASFSFDCRDKQILVVEDEYDIGDIIEQYLKREGMRVIRAMNGKQAIEIHASQPIDLILLDIKLPELNGWEVLSKIRQKAQTPVIMLTARSEEDHKVQGLDAGADDYMTKPFSTRELVSRIKAVLRRSNALGGEKTIDANGLILDPMSQRVSFGNNILEMGPTEYRLLAFFMTHPERAYTRAQLLDQVWGGNVYIEDRTIDVHIRRLRKVLEPYNADRFVQTVRGTGYRFSTRADAVLG
jgi:two-component system phosphate regulon response regulator PhoB